MPGINQREEQGVVNQIEIYLVVRRIPYYRARNTGSIYWKNGVQHFGRTRFSQKGAPDFFAWFKGKSYAIEVKAKEGRLSNDQKEWLSRFQLNGGGQVIIARSLEDVQGGMGI